MPQIFHPSMNTISRVTIFGAIGFVFVAMAIGAVIVRSPYAPAAGVVRTQPVPFSHQQRSGISTNRCTATSREREPSLRSVKTLCRSITSTEPM